MCRLSLVPFSVTVHSVENQEDGRANDEDKAQADVEVHTQQQSHSNQVGADESLRPDELVDLADCLARKTVHD